MKRLLFVSFLFLIFALPRPAVGQEDSSSYSFEPAFQEEEKWIVTYQSQFSCRFQIYTQGKQMAEETVKKVQNRKYTKTFHKIEGNRPVKVEHFYVVANEKTKKGSDDNQSTTKLPEQGAQVMFNWNSESGKYETTNTSHDLSKEAKERVTARELYELFLPSKKVSVGGDPWKPSVSKPLAVLFSTDDKEGSPSLMPELETFACELSNIRSRNDRKIGVIDILMKTKESSRNSDDLFARIHGQLLFDLNRQKPIRLTLSSRPVGISFRRDIQDGELRVNDMGLFINIQYDTSGENTLEEPEKKKNEGAEEKSEQGSNVNSGSDSGGNGK